MVALQTSQKGFFLTLPKTRRKGFLPSCLPPHLRTSWVGGPVVLWCCSSGCCVLAFSSFPPLCFGLFAPSCFGALCLFCFSCLGVCLSGCCCSVSSHYMRPVFVLFCCFSFVPGVCCLCLLSFSAVFCPVLRVFALCLVFIPPPRFSCIVEHFKRLFGFGCILPKIKEQPPPVFWVLVALLVLLVAALVLVRSYAVKVF